MARITRIESLHADGGWRPFSFLKVTTDTGLVGWSEYARGLWAPALPEIIAAMGARLVGRDPSAFAQLGAELAASVRFNPGGLAQQAIAAIENACIDLAAKAAGLPVYALFGGPMRQSLDLYWSHCGSFRARDARFFTEVLGRSPLRSLKDMERLGEEVIERGYRAAKINPIVFSRDGPVLLNPGFVPGLDFGRRMSDATAGAIAEQLEAFLAGVGDRAEVMLDLNFGLSATGFERLARRLAGLKLKWLEFDIHHPAALKRVRDAATMPVASLEAVYGRQGYAPFLTLGVPDVAVIDVLWNGLTEAVRIANLAEMHEINVAPHNFYGPLSDLMAAHFCAVVPNFEIMEIEADDVPWKYDLLTRPINVTDGRMVLGDAPGWGAEVSEEMVAAHPWRGQ